MTLDELSVPLPWVNHTVEIAEALGLLLEKNETLAGVTDEYGSFEGVLKLSDSALRVLSPLLQPSMEATPDDRKLRSKVFRGDTPVGKLSGWFPTGGLRAATGSTTLNGVLTGHLGYIPQAGDKFAIEDWNFYIIKANPVKIESVLIRKKEPL